MTNAEIVAWHRNTAKRLKAEGKLEYALEHENIAKYFQGHPELND